MKKYNKNSIYQKCDMNEYNDEFKKDCPNYKIIPTIIDKVDRIIAIGDLHGDINLTMNILIKANLIVVNNYNSLDFTTINYVHWLSFIKNNIIWIGKSTYIVQVGDQVDRCRPTSAMDFDCNNQEITTNNNDEASDIKILELFTELDNKASEKNGRVISLMGNHEIMNVLGDMRYVSHKGIMQFCDNTTDSNICKENRIRSFKPGEKYANFLACTRISTIVIGSNLFVHAGIIRKFIVDLKNKYNIDIQSACDLSVINTIMRKWLLNQLDDDVTKYLYGNINSIFWNRILHNISSKSCNNIVGNILKLFNVGQIIIGHTPQQQITSCCNNTVWKIDLGMSKAFDNFKSNDRKFQILEILNDTIFNIINIDYTPIY